MAKSDATITGTLGSVPAFVDADGFRVALDGRAGATGLELCVEPAAADEPAARPVVVVEAIEEHDDVATRDDDGEIVFANRAYRYRPTEKAAASTSGRANGYPVP